DPAPRLQRAKEIRVHRRGIAEMVVDVAHEERVARSGRDVRSGRGAFDHRHVRESGSRGRPGDLGTTVRIQVVAVDLPRGADRLGHQYRQLTTPGADLAD